MFAGVFESHSLRQFFNQLQTTKSRRNQLARETFEFACAISFVTTSPYTVSGVRISECRMSFCCTAIGVPAPETLAVVNSWRQTTQFAYESDWMFASPAQIGRLPLSYPWVWRSFQ
jgi:hypothetical protein